MEQRLRVPDYVFVLYLRNIVLISSLFSIYILKYIIYIKYLIFFKYFMKHLLRLHSIFEKKMLLRSINGAKITSSVFTFEKKMLLRSINGAKITSTMFRSIYGIVIVNN